MAISTELNLDLERLSRQGFPEVVYGQGKTREQIIHALQTLHLAHGSALATRVPEDLGISGKYDACSRLYQLGQQSQRPGKPPVVSAGTADQPLAEEAAQTLEFLGYTTARVRDVGVAGLHRLLARLDELHSADAIIVVAGMEGALASVVGGLVSQPVIAVPTSTGYGAGAHGQAALLSMLNSCAAGVAVMNIDNGFGAAIAVHRILKRIHG